MLVPKMKELVYLQTSRLREYSVDVVLIGRKATVRKGGRMDSENKIDITTEKAQPCLCGFMAAHNIGCRHFFAWRKEQADWKVRPLALGSRDPSLRSLLLHAPPPPSPYPLPSPYPPSPPSPLSPR